MIAVITPTQYALTCVIGLGLILALAWACNRLLARLARHEYPELRSTPSHVPPVTHIETPKTRTCSNCQHFDLEEGKAALEQNPAFVAATKHLTPARMLNRPPGRKGPDDPGSNVVPLKAKWTDFGACLMDSEVRYGGDGCARFTPKVQA